jgi:tripartite-type tricarboxylate transporter receptor subunit TctC
VLGVAAERRVIDYPDIPTMREGGVDLVISSWHGMFAPKGTPREILVRLDHALERVCSNPEFIAHMRSLLLGVRYLGSKEFREFFAEADKINLDLIRKLGLLVAAPGAAK